MIALFERISSQWRWIIPILIADLLGMAFGWFYYYDVGQFDPGHREFVTYWLWPLVADSPNAVLLFFAALLLGKLGWRNRWLDAAAFTLNVYVGLWTTFLFIVYADAMGTFEWGSTNNLLFVSHMGMPLQAFLLWPRIREDDWGAGIIAIAAAAAAYIYVDYWGPVIHPAPFLHPDDAALHAGSPILMVLALAALLLVARPWQRSTPPPASTP